MGYSVALMADSTSRWAEALREISGRMEEMPGEEGYPAYLGTSVASFYERAGKVSCMGQEEKTGSLSVIGAVSPPGGDLTDPVVQMTLRVVKVFWGLDDKLAYQRHFPAINWLTSYSLYEENIKNFLQQDIGEDFIINRKESIAILEKESDLNEIVRLVGMETLSTQDKLLLETARSIREDFLHQSAFDERDAYTTLKKQYKMLNSILIFHRLANKQLETGALLEDLLKMPIREKIVRARYISPEKISEFDELEEEIRASFNEKR
jgi:V/A-type H+-transporting ATPase subunit A